MAMADILADHTSIETLIPQRAPIRMVDTLFACDEAGCSTGLTITPDNMFCDASGRLGAEGVIEHMAQSAAARQGYLARKTGGSARIGYIGEVRDFVLLAGVGAGDRLTTTIEVVSEVIGVLLVQVQTARQGDPIASCRLKISV